MAYQSASTSTTGRPPVQESYGGTITDDPSSNNVGLSNSARGGGTTTSEMVAKLRFFNCIVCAYLILFHCLPLVINPIRLALLLKSPIRLLLEVLVGVLSISMFTTEARMPIFAEKILIGFRKCRVGNVHLIDLDVARGRVVAIVLMTMAIGTVNHMNMHNSLRSGHGGSNHTMIVAGDPVDDSVFVNGTNSSAALNETIPGIDDDIMTASHASTHNYTSDGSSAITRFLFAVVCSTIFSLSMWLLLSLLSYTLYVIKEYPSYSEYREFPHLQDDSTSSSGASRPLSPASARSWVSNIPDFTSITGGGYQSVDNPIHMNV